MERLTTDNPKNNLQTALNLFYAKDGEAWVRGGGPEYEYQDVPLFSYIRSVIQHQGISRHLWDELDDETLAEVLTEWLFDGHETTEGIIATLYTAAWAFAELRARLKAYEDTGLTPEEMGKPLAEFLHPVDNYNGLKGKYLVFKADTGEQIANCFVLRPDKDPAAVEALRAYAQTTDNDTLAGDIYNWVGKGVVISNSETTTKWIPVSERLPEVGKSVIVYNAPAKCAAEAVYKGEGKFLQFRWAARLQEQEVTHWMHLPQPPKGE